MLFELPTTNAIIRNVNISINKSITNMVTNNISSNVNIT